MGNYWSQTTSKRQYGWKKGKPDMRDLWHNFTPKDNVTVPPKIDMRPEFPPIYDQGQLGSCVANAVAGGMQYTMMKLALPDVTPRSRLFIYFNARAKEGTIYEDAGSTLRDGMKVAARMGSCTEATWPYVITYFTTMPTQKSYDDGAKCRVSEYRRVTQDLTQLKLCLSQNTPIACGVLVYSSFENPAVDKTGKVPLPGQGEKLLGGHAILLVGYDDSQNSFIFRNSWGAAWGDKGYGYIPYDYIVNPMLSDDFWTLTIVKEDPNAKPDAVAEAKVVAAQAKCEHKLHKAEEKKAEEKKAEEKKAEDKKPEDKKVEGNKVNPVKPPVSSAPTPSCQCQNKVAPRRTAVKQPNGIVTQKK
jgi:C1A family cysteine protease